MRRHEQGAAVLARQMGALGALRTDLTPEPAAGVFALMTSPATWRQLTQRTGWTFDESELRLVASLSQLLLAVSPALPG
jgi:hypothetical protein